MKQASLQKSMIRHADFPGLLLFRIRMKRQWMVVLMLFSTLLIYGQRTVDGTITDAESGESLIGVTVQIKGTTVGTISDIDGNYRLVSGQLTDTSTLVFSYIGYAKVEKVLGNLSTIDIQLSSGQTLLDEVVVIGYGTAKRRDVLGAVSKVGNKEINRIAVQGIDQALQGRAAGVQVTQNTGAPGEGVNVRIRGIGSINSGNEPLYIVDGIATADALKILSPGDIETITVLKDASSAAIYGSRSTNGIVLITTKKGVEGKTKVTYRGQTGFQKAVNLTDMVNTSDYITIYNEAASNDNANLLPGLPERKLITPADAENFANVNYLDELFRIAPVNSHELSVSGGNESTSFILSASLFDQKGIIKSTDFTRVNARIDVNTKVSKWLTSGISMLVGKSDNDIIGSSGDGAGGNGGSVIRYAFFRNPAIPVKSENGNYIDRPAEYFGNQVYDSFLGDGYNPIGMTAHNDNNRKDNTYFGKAFFTARITKKLSFTTNFGMDYRDSEFRRFNSTWGTFNRINAVNSLSVSNEQVVNWTINNVFNYEAALGELHNISVMAGFEAIKTNGKSLYASDMDFPVEQKELIFIGNGTGNKISGQSAWASSLASFFGRISYNFNGKYYLSGTLRRDGTSRFIKKNKWGTFYSLSAGWLLKQENFLKNAAWLHNLKLRAGYGAVGNQDINLYANKDRVSPYYNYPFGGFSNSGYAQSALGNENLKWETSNQVNAGLDAELWKGALAFSFDYFYKITEGMLVKASNPPSSGYASPAWINNGSVLNTGIEMEVMYNKTKEDWGYTISGNIAFLHNEIVELEAPLDNGLVETGQNATHGEVGKPIGSFFLLEMDGIFQNDTEILLSALQGPNVQPGDVKFKDHFVDGLIDNKDRVHLGSAFPKFSGGLNLAGTYKSFDISMFFQGVYGNKIYMQVNQDIEGFYRGFTVTQRYFDERWTGEGTSNTQPRPSWSSKSNNARPSSRFLEDGSYLRLKNVQLGYTIPEKTIKIAGITNARIYISGTNLFTLTGYPGLDPEMTVSDNAKNEGDNAAGIDWGTYPSAMNVMLGLDIIF